MIDFSKKYNRLFAIGCSFTNYNNWPTWASVLSQELNIPLYNLGHSGASNKYIQNQLFLLDETYKLTQDDLVITQWTGHNRLSVLGDSFWSESDEWKHYGDVTEKWKGHGRATTDFKKSVMEGIQSFQTQRTLELESVIAIESSLLYQDTLKCTCINLQMFPISDKITLPSFLSVLYPTSNSYGDVLENFVKIHTESEPEITAMYSKYRTRELLLKSKYKVHTYDIHPLPTEHVVYLEKVFNCTFSNYTKDLAKADEKKWFSNPDSRIVKDRDNTFYGLEQLQKIVSLPG